MGFHIQRLRHRHELDPIPAALAALDPQPRIPNAEFPDGSRQFSVKSTTTIDGGCPKTGPPISSPHNRTSLPRPERTPR